MSSCSPNLRTRNIESREEWLSWRKKVIGASEAGAILGIDPWRTPLAVYYDKRGELQRDSSELAERGIDLEPGIVNAFRRRHPEYHVYAPDVFYDDPAFRVGCTPDAFFTWEENGKPKHGVLQCKLVSRKVFETQWQSGETPPIYYKLQTLVEAKLTGADRAILYAYVIDEFGGKPYEFEITVDDPNSNATFDIFLRSAQYFWDRFDKQEPPPVNADMDGKTLHRVFREDNGQTVDMDGDEELREWIERHETLSAQIAMERHAASNEAHKERERLRTLIKAKIGAAESIKVGGNLVSWKTTKLQREKQSYRVLRIIPIKPDSQE